MKLREAIQRARESGGYVVYHYPHDYPVDKFRGRAKWRSAPSHYWNDGRLHWTYGGAAGGKLKEDWAEDKRIKAKLDKEGFAVYPEFGQRCLPAASGKQFWRPTQV